MKASRKLVYFLHLAVCLCRGIIRMHKEVMGVLYSGRRPWRLVSFVFRSEDSVYVHARSFWIGLSGRTAAARF
jgi:hypothetical protein